eukprot:scaffold3513_cov127-Isochrysis_galbana.AAC.9
MRPGAQEHARRELLHFGRDLENTAERDRGAPEERTQCWRGAAVEERRRKLGLRKEARKVKCMARRRALHTRNPPPLSRAQRRAELEIVAEAEYEARRGEHGGPPAQANLQRGGARGWEARRRAAQEKRARAGALASTGRRCTCRASSSSRPRAAIRKLAGSSCTAHRCFLWSHSSRCFASCSARIATSSASASRTASARALCCTSIRPTVAARCVSCASSSAASSSSAARLAAGLAAGRAALILAPAARNWAEFC